MTNLDALESIPQENLCKQTMWAEQARGTGSSDLTSSTGLPAINKLSKAVARTIEKTVILLEQALSCHGTLRVRKRNCLSANSIF